jgi:hypothetical protein
VYVYVCCHCDGYIGRLVLTALALGLGQQLTGTEAILYYTPTILNQCDTADHHANATQLLSHANATTLYDPSPPTTDLAIDQAESVAESAGCTGVDAVFWISIGVGTCIRCHGSHTVHAPLRCIREATLLTNDRTALLYMLHCCTCCTGC